MNKHQMKALQILTNQINARYHDGMMAFNVIPAVAGSQSLIFSASNYRELRWFETTRDFYAIIGPRGGIEKYDGNINV